MMGGLFVLYALYLEVKLCNRPYMRDHQNHYRKDIPYSHYHNMREMNEELDRRYYDSDDLSDSDCSYGREQESEDLSEE